MQIGRIAGSAYVAGKEQGYVPLPFRVEFINCKTNGPDTPSMVSAWFPSSDEIARIAAGAPIYLRVVGVQHPPVGLEVGEPPVEDDEQKG